MPVTESAIAKVLGISRMSLWRIHRRNPGLRPWVSAQLAATNVHLIAPVIHMLGTMAVRTKSPRHAELFLRAVGALGPANGAPRDDEEESPEDSRYVTHVNILVPCPQLPNGGRMPALGPQPAIGLPDGVDLKDIPTVVVR